MNIQLVLSHYLAGLRERYELDALLPELLRAMGHSVQSRPQVGANQAGVDIVSTHANANGAKEVFLYVVKFGDLGREDFYGGKQAVDPSVREAANDFVRNRLPEPLKALKKRIVLVTNGTLKQEAQAGYAALEATTRAVFVPFDEASSRRRTATASGRTATVTLPEAPAPSETLRRSGEPATSTTAPPPAAEIEPSIRLTRPTNSATNRFAGRR